MSNCKALDESELLPKWLRDAMDRPPPAPCPEEQAKSERHGRLALASQIRDRIPRFVATPKLSELSERIACEELMRAARSWHPSTHGNLALLGSTGRGKTTAAALIYRRLLRDGWRDGGEAWALAQGMRWMRAEALERAMRGHPLGQGDCPDYREAVHASVLVLDELGWESYPRLIASVLAERYDSPRLTIITSGKTLGQLRDDYGDAAIRRMVTYHGRAPVVVQSFASEKKK